MVLLLAAGTSQAESLVTRHLGTPVSRNVLYMSQEITLSGDIGSSAKIAPLTMSSAGFGIEKNAVKLAGLPVTGLPRISIANPTSTTAALEAANNWTSSNMPAFQSRVGNYIRAQGLSSAFFTFTQEIMVSTVLGTKKQAVGFNVTVDQNGRPLYGAPKIIDPDPLILEAMYTPQAAVDGLPPNWAYPDAGSIKYRVLNKKYEPLTGYTSIPTGGAFDEDINSSDPDTKLKCLMDLRYPGCTGPTDIRTLAGQVGASLAIVDYVRRLEPDYDTLADGTQVARGAISYDARIWDCTSYVNRGYFGYVLRIRAERYAMTPTGDLAQYQLLQQFGGKTISPTEPFQKSVPISSLGGQNPQNVVISANPGDNSLWSVGNAEQMRNVVYLAPVKAQGGDGVLSAASFSGDMSVQQTSAVGSTREYYIGTVCKACWSTGTYDRTVTFNLDSPQSLDEFAMIQEGFDDWLLVAVNGTTVFVGPKGGNMLNISYGSTGENDCAWNGSSYTCQHPYAATQFDAQGNPVSPGANCTYSTYYDWETGYSSGTWNCPVNYNWCDANGGYDGYTGPAYSCRNTPCPDGAVQFMSNAGYTSWVPWNGAVNGCGSQELSTSWRFNNYVDLRPYLHSGNNSIFMRTITYGKGEGFIQVRSQACGASMGLDAGDPPPVPSSGGSGGVTTTVVNQAQQ
jgi:hypothetical protein